MKNSEKFRKIGKKMGENSEKSRKIEKNLEKLRIIEKNEEK